MPRQLLPLLAYLLRKFIISLTLSLKRLISTRPKSPSKEKILTSRPGAVYAEVDAPWVEIVGILTPTDNLSSFLTLVFVFIHLKTPNLVMSLASLVALSPVII